MEKAVKFYFAPHRKISRSDTAFTTSVSCDLMN